MAEPGFDELQEKFMSPIMNILSLELAVCSIKPRQLPRLTE